MVNKYLIILYFVWCFILTGCITEKHTTDPQIKDYICTCEYDVKHNRGEPFTVDSEGKFYLTDYSIDDRMNIKKYNSQGKYITGWVPEIKRRKKNCWFLERKNSPVSEELTDILTNKEYIYLAYSAAYGFNFNEGNFPIDYISHIEQFDLNGKFITAIKPEKDSFHRDFVRFITKGKSGNFYLASWRHIEKYDANWKLQSILYPFEQKWYVRSTFPSGTIIGDLAVDAEGYIYILISGSGCFFNGAKGHITKFDSSGKFIKEWISEDKDNFNAHGLEIDPNDNIYILQIGDHKIYRIQKFDSSLNFVTRWDFEGKTIDNYGTQYTDIKIDSKGNVYVDSGNGNIKKFSPKQ